MRGFPVAVVLSPAAFAGQYPPRNAVPVEPDTGEVRARRDVVGGRMELVGLQPEIDRLNRYCASQKER